MRQQTRGKGVLDDCWMRNIKQTRGRGVLDAAHSED